MIQRVGSNNFYSNFENLAHSENLKSAKFYIMLYYQPLWAKTIANLSGKFIKIRWFSLKSSKIYTMGQFLKKCSTDFFLIYHSLDILECLWGAYNHASLSENSPQNFTALFTSSLIFYSHSIDYYLIVDTLCHYSCLGGCFGATNRECFACANYMEDGRCVNKCSLEKWEFFKASNPTFITINF
jgi:hypothetical protein